MIRPRGATTRRRDDEAKIGPSCQEIGQLLRTAREGRGLDLLAVHDRLNRPITQIEALENGDLDRLEDRDSAITAVRRYATFLGLDGQVLAGQLARSWPPPATNGPPGNGDATAAVVLPTGRRPRAGSAATTQVPRTDGSPEHLRAFTQTGEVPRFGVAPRAPVGDGAGPPTGTFPVVPRKDLRASRRAVARARRRLRAPLWLKVLTWLVAACLLVVAAGWAIRTWNPQWLVRAHVLRTTSRPGATTGTSGPGSTPVGSQGRPASHQAGAAQLVAAGPSAAAYVVSGPRFTLSVATSAPSWIRITSSSSAVPLLNSVQPANQVFTYKATGTMTVAVGTSAVVVGVAVKGKPPFLGRPPAVPFTYTFTPSKS
ncbi:MAG TPA: helix-turn-helix transcriptional regulator [Acidimicrobiales bacterium]|nr:helix-turn-helix transcriptional regulator [Acidimicrobiales bacterium]